MTNCTIGIDGRSDGTQTRTRRPGRNWQIAVGALLLNILPGDNGMLKNQFEKKIDPMTKMKILATYETTYDAKADLKGLR